jgi:ABC-2 type transport system ATP-binding protein
MPEPPAAAVAAESLGRRFGELVAVDELSFEVARGELFGLVGPDGAGKTTTLRMLAGVLPPSSGDARVAGVGVRRDPEGVKRRIAYMPQRFGLYTDLTVAQNLRFYADLFEVPRAERERTLARLYEFSRLEPFRDRLAGDLSGGMKQKLGLSCALIHRPEVLLLDEPTFGVDPVSRRELWLIVHEMVAAGMTAVVSTSYLDEAERFDRLLLLHRGRRVAHGRPAELRAPLAGRMLEATAADPRRARAAARGEAGAAAGVVRAELFGERLHLTLDRAGREAAEVADALRHAGAGEVEVRSLAPSLEDAFVELVAAPPDAAPAGPGAAP